MMKKVLITGISGFAGRHLAKHLLKKGDYSIFGTYNSKKSLKVLENIRESVHSLKIDLTDIDKTHELLRAEKPDYVYHLAALTSPAESFQTPLKTIRDNVAMEINLLEAIRKEELHKTRILIVSSADIYGIVEKNDLPINEETQFHPTNPYAISKLTQDFLGYQYAIAYNLKIIRVRPFNHIGPFKSPQFVVSAFAKSMSRSVSGLN